MSALVPKNRQFLLIKTRAERLCFHFLLSGRLWTAVIAAQGFNQGDIGAEPLGLDIQQQSCCAMAGRRASCAA
jgi:hypothetical protein